jgi:PAS domain S-box-containing protein
MAKRRGNRTTERPVVILFDTAEDLKSGETLLKKLTKMDVSRLGLSHHGAPEHDTLLRVRDVAGLHTWLRSAKRRPLPTRCLLTLAGDFDRHQRMLSALASMRLQFSDVLTSSQDQIWVLDQEQRMVAFFGHWPKESPRRPDDLLGKRKRDVFGPDVAAAHEAAGQRALNGEASAFEWSITDKPTPTHLFTAASPLRNGNGEIAGVLLVTRNITPLKEAQLKMEQALQEKANQLF